jgi:N-acetylglucosamine-6-phosphate deacetylase
MSGTTGTGGGYVDLQVNGYAGVDFNADDLNAESLHRACARLEQDGVAAILATVITDEVELMGRRMGRLAQLRGRDPLAARMIAGIHVEGPFISPVDGYRGAHPADAVRPVDLEIAQRLLEAGQGLVRLVTLAPEQDAGQRLTRMLAGQGVLVAAGHSNGSLDELRGAIDAGLSLFTHLGNGCPMTMHRHDNIIQRVLSLSDRLWITFIADGVHIPFFALGNYLRAAGGAARCVVVTDAMSAAGLGPGEYRIGRWEVSVGEDLAAWAPDRSHLVGSAGTMARSDGNLRDALGLGAEERDRLLRGNAARLLGRG